MKNVCLGLCGLLWTVAATAKTSGVIVEGPTMSACIKSDSKQKTIGDTMQSPQTKLVDDQLILDLTATAFHTVTTSALPDERIVTTLCSGRVGFEFEVPHRLDRYTLLIGSVAFGSSRSPDDYVRVAVRGVMSSEEGISNFESSWPDALRASDFKGDGPYPMQQQEEQSVCGQRLNLRIDQIEAQARGDSSSRANNRLSVSQLSFHFVPCL